MATAVSSTWGLLLCPLTDIQPILKAKHGQSGLECKVSSTDMGEGDKWLNPEGSEIISGLTPWWIYKQRHDLEMLKSRRLTLARVSGRCGWLPGVVSCPGPFLYPFLGLLSAMRKLLIIHSLLDDVLAGEWGQDAMDWQFRTVSQSKSSHQFFMWGILSLPQEE